MPRPISVEHRMRREKAAAVTKPLNLIIGNVQDCAKKETKAVSLPSPVKLLPIEHRAVPVGSHGAAMAQNAIDDVARGVQIQGSLPHSLMKTTWHC